MRDVIIKNVSIIKYDGWSVSGDLCQGKDGDGNDIFGIQEKPGLEEYGSILWDGITLDLCDTVLSIGGPIVKSAMGLKGHWSPPLMHNIEWAKEAYDLPIQWVIFTKDIIFMDRTGKMITVQTRDNENYLVIFHSKPKAKNFLEMIKEYYPHILIIG